MPKNLPFAKLNFQKMLSKQMQFKNFKKKLID